ncbi:hypothetical protein C8T65DRAFT_700213 [Cerioporus squamosus]|nr:hypothetical protein C8T65DRAFT_700213 [Cerioporus squamosus]
MLLELSGASLLVLLLSWFLPWNRRLSSPSLGNTSAHMQVDHHATVLGRAHGSVESFLGIPYAQPPGPVGEFRFRLPRLIDSYNGNAYVDATDILEVIGPYFGRFAIDPTVPVSQSEDCE